MMFLLQFDHFYLIVAPQSPAPVADSSKTSNMLDIGLESVTFIRCSKSDYNLSDGTLLCNCTLKSFQNLNAQVRTCSLYTGC